MSVILTLRVTQEQRERWQEAANQEGLPLSGWMRKRCDAGQKNNGGEQPKKSPRDWLAELLSAC
ncbi:MAG: hypothetical protein WBW14_17460 [Candidatus Acidiferrum sp.]